MKRALVLTICLFLFVPGIASAARYPAVVNGHAPSLHPEGITFDPTRRAFLVGSLEHGTVSIVTPDGRAITLADDPRVLGVAGVHVDVARGRILAAYGDNGLPEGSEPDPAKRRTGLAIFDLRTGNARHVVDLAVGPGHTANDVTFDHEGNAYVTDSSADVIYKVDPAGRPSEFVRDARFAPVPGLGVGINGIAWHPGGFLLVGKYDTGQLFRVSTGEFSRPPSPHRVPGPGRPEVTEVRLDRPLLGADGIALHHNGDLVVVTNDPLVPGSQDALTVLRSRDNYRTASERSRDIWPVNDPTTVAVSPFGDYAVSGELVIWIGGGTSDNFTLRRR